MALIKCKECGKEISNQAKLCPNCGAPTEKFNQKKKTNNKIIIGGILGIVVVTTIIIVVVSIMSGIRSKQKSYIYGNEAINILLDYKNRILNEEDAYKQLDQLYNAIEEELEKINDSSKESSRLFGIKIGVSSAKTEIDYDGLSQFEIEDKIEYIKEQMNGY